MRAGAAGRRQRVLQHVSAMERTQSRPHNVGRSSRDARLWLLKLGRGELSRRIWPRLKGMSRRLGRRTTSTLSLPRMRPDPLAPTKYPRPCFARRASPHGDRERGGRAGVRVAFACIGAGGSPGPSFDMGPSLGAINRSVLLAMDFFVVPMSIDVFSAWAIRNIGTTVAIWQKELRTGIALAEDPAELASIDRTRAIKFLGYVTQQHRERTEEDLDTPIIESDDVSDVRRRRIVQAYEEISEKFPEQISESLGQFFGFRTNRSVSGQRTASWKLSSKIAEPTLANDLSARNWPICSVA